jgi:hypothetical protein
MTTAWANRLQCGDHRLNCLLGTRLSSAALMKKLSRHVRVVRSRVSAIRALVVVPNSRMNGGFGREVEIILDFGKGSYRTIAAICG